MSEPLSGLDAALTEIADERGRQDAKWGEQNHPLLDPDLAAWISDTTPSVSIAGLGAARFYRVPTATIARESCQANDPGHDNWAAILLEEFCEFLEAAALADEPGARAELVQLGAVAAAAVEAMDRRKT